MSTLKKFLSCTLSVFLLLTVFSCSDGGPNDPSGDDPSKKDDQKLDLSEKGYNIIFDKNDGSGEKIVEPYDTASSTVI